MVEAGVQRLYTVPGESFLEVLDAAERHPATRQFSTRHESGASFMAEADAKLTGVPAVAMATRGPGAANLSIGVHTAHQDSTPMLVLLGDVETPWIYRGAFQEVDLSAFYGGARGPAPGDGPPGAAPLGLWQARPGDDLPARRPAGGGGGACPAA
jgi:acetolactate synthase-1/2/3 large subunit